MLRILVILAVLSGASAFGPFMNNMRSKLMKLKMAFEDEIGALKPTGFWDPLGKELKDNRTLECTLIIFQNLALISFAL